MLDRDYVRLMAEYNAWMNDKLYAACAQLADEERKRDRGAFFKSIHGTLNHLVWADRAFLIRLLAWDLPMGKPADVLFDEFEPLRTRADAPGRDPPGLGNRAARGRARRAVRDVQRDLPAPPQDAALSARGADV